MEEQEGWKKQYVRYLPNFHPSNAYEETKHKFDIEKEIYLWNMSILEKQALKSAHSL